MAHCSYFACAMNESKSILQAESQPLFLCPVCLRKLQKAVGFDIVERYKALCTFLNSITHSSLSNKIVFQNNCYHSGERGPLESSECKFELSIYWIKSILMFIENKNTIWLNELCANWNQIRTVHSPGISLTFSAGFHRQADLFNWTSLQGKLSPRWSNQVGNIILTVSQFFQYRALIETPAPWNTT